MSEFTCTRCAQARDRMAAVPFPNELGGRIYDSICGVCWQDWLKEQTAIINHYGLNLLDPKSKLSSLNKRRSSCLEPTAHPDSQVSLTFDVNGERTTVQFSPHKTLLEVLREDLQLTGTKHGCELGECGTCAVTVDGVPVLSCLIVAAGCAGKDIRTVEGMAAGPTLHPLQDAFAEMGAAQCGYCTPGFLVTAEALLETNPSPTRQDIKDALAGNLCRCTGYIKIYEAVELAAARMRGETAEPTRRRSMARSDLRVVGHPQRKVDATDKVTGKTLFADDLTRPRMLWAKLLRSPHPHARIISIDTSAAEALDGVHLVLTGQDTPIPFGILPVSQDEHALVPEHVRFIGDPVAAVAARTEEIATAAVELIEIKYELLKPIGSIQEAIDSPDERIHDYGPEGNFHKTVNLQFGDVDEGFEESDHVREDVFFFEGNTHLPMEQHSALAEYSADGYVTLWSSTQTPHYVHRALAKVLEMPASRVRVVACPNGGGFGGKSDPFSHEIVVAKMAMLTGRPVKITLTREEVFYCHRGRHPVLMRSKAGVSKDGKIKSLRFDSVLDGGGYGSYGVASTYYTGALQTVTYEVERYHFRGARVFTNKAPCGPKRGHGTPQPRFALEVQVDKIAADLGIDPADIRLNHLQPPDSVTANYLAIGSMGLQACIEKVIEGSGWKERYGKLPEGRGLGLACSSYISGAGLPIYWNNMPHSGVQLKCDRSGGVTVFCGSTDIGQGSDSILAYIVAEVFGVDPFEIKVVTADTDLTPVDLGSYSSRVTLMSGNAALQAAERARDQIAKAVADKLEIPASRIVFADGNVFDAESPEDGVNFAKAIQIAEAATGTVGTVGSYRPPRSPGRYRGAGVGPSPAYSYSASVIEVEVDPSTGLYTVEHVWIAHDIGQSINPTTVMGQVEGSVYMGLGEAMMEEMSYRPNRNVVHKIPSLLEYKSPTTHEMPDVTTYLVGEPDKNGPFGGKEVGQGPLLPMMPAVANAVYDAVGVRVDEVPVTPEKILKALKAKAKGNDPTHGPKKFPDVPWPEPTLVPPPWEGGDGNALPEENPAGETQPERQH